MKIIKRKTKRSANYGITMVNTSLALRGQATGFACNPEKKVLARPVRASYGNARALPKTLFSLGRSFLRPLQIFSASIFPKSPLKFAVVSLEF